MCIPLVFLSLLGSWSQYHLADGECVGQPSDVIFVLDSSGSICSSGSLCDKDIRTCDNWETTLAFTDSLIEELEISRSATRVGVVVYGNTASVEVPLGEFLDRDPLLERVAGISYEPLQERNTSGGLLMMMKEFEVGSSSASTLQIGVVITDGKSTRDSDLTVPNAEKARERGIVLFAVGVTESDDVDELKGISSEPQERNRNYFVSTSFAELNQIGKDISVEICEVVQAESPITTAAPEECDDQRTLVLVLLSAAGALLLILTIVIAVTAARCTWKKKKK